MNDVTTTAPLDEVRGLVDERSRYEGWLSALDARRAVTPAHVFERVRSDYEGRLRRVVDILDSHSGALRADEAALSSHHDDRMRVLGERRDLLAEVELRTLVGEFPPEEGERQRREVEGEISTLESALSVAAVQLGELRTLLGRVSPEPGGMAGSAAHDTRPASDHDTSAAGDVAAVATPGGEGHRAPNGSGGMGESGTHGTPGDPLGLDAARAALGDPDVHGYAPGPHYAPSMRAAADARSTPPYAGQSFADAAFTGSAAGGTPTPPNPGGSITQEKTLRCPDCSAMNYPTEWYCEKCGGELAAL
jgi:hypothetical protein